MGHTAARRGGRGGGAAAARVRGPGGVPRFLASARLAGLWRDCHDQWPLVLQPPDAELWRLTPEFAGLGAPVLDAETFGKWTPEPAARLGPGLAPGAGRGQHRVVS
ncbi:hypothetical protein [Streptomyces griseoluteus]|uniref:hypothetical protein n=1 Tax=Streptomyces griseoluteus TaxID=29306 RepID=UPI0019AB2603|nr:hypothetical protein [Streptomyces griseoluteus]GHE99631.1 hypothetical protein GCM10017776_15700 [Streptomyces griseoluteus]